MNLEMATEIRQLNAPLLTWLAVHGNLCLALRHPANLGKSRERMVGLIRTISVLLVDSGFMTQEEMDQATRYEAQQGNRI
jgi:hypothetical protein